MLNESEHLNRLIVGMREAYARGENAMEFARNHCADSTEGVSNLSAAVLIAYDLQAGSYTLNARSNFEANHQWCAQICHEVKQFLPLGGSILEVGSGEATTLAGVVRLLGKDLGSAYGFDLSWSRIAEGKRYLSEQAQKANLFVGDLFNIPLLDNSVDVVYSSHSLEPNGGREKSAIAECLRVARHAVVLVEPAYEFADEGSRLRMEHHGYVRNLSEAALQLGATVLAHRLLEYTPNPLNPSGIWILTKGDKIVPEPDQGLNIWRCPLTGGALTVYDDMYYAVATGIAYPVMRGIPLLRAEHAVVASKIKSFGQDINRTYAKEILGI